MSNPQNNIHLLDAIIKIEALISAAQFLTSSDEEIQTQHELMGIIEGIARKAQQEAEK